MFSGCLHKLYNTVTFILKNYSMSTVLQFTLLGSKHCTLNNGEAENVTVMRKTVQDHM